VLGANLGTAINPLLESGLTGYPTGKRLPVGNLINRVVGCALGLGLLNWLGPKLVALDPDPARAVADFHTAAGAVHSLPRIRSAMAAIRAQSIQIPSAIIQNTERGIGEPLSGMG
jgi:Na+/phosphate symporter